MRLNPLFLGLQFPAGLRDDLQTALGTKFDYWAGVAGYLNLLPTHKINYHANNPDLHSGGNGALVFQQWSQSNLTHKDLVSALNHVGLERFATKVDHLFGGGSKA